MTARTVSVCVLVAIVLPATSVLCFLQAVRKGSSHSDPGRACPAEPVTPLSDNNVPPSNPALAEPKLEKAADLPSSTKPEWAVAYGKEFWRSAVHGHTQTGQVESGSSRPTSANLGEVIERVSHAWEVGTNGTFKLEARTYAATLDEQGLRFSPRLPAGQASLRADSNPSAEIQFRTVSVRREDNFFYSAGQFAPDQSVVGNTAQLLLEPSLGLIEHYETRSDGLAVAWVVPNPLPGEGAMVLAAELKGLTWVGQTAEGHHFAAMDGIARARVGKVTVVDSAGRTWPVDMKLSAQQIEIEVPQTILAQAQYPLAIDPLISPEFGVDEPVLAPGIGQYRPSIAGNGNNYLVVWEDTRHAQWPEYQTHIYAARLTIDGRLEDPTGIAICIAAGNQSTPKVAADANNYFVVWGDDRQDSRTDIYGTRVSSGGRVLDGDGIPICTTNGGQGVPATAASSEGFLVVWADSRGGVGPHIYGTMVSSGGIVANLNGTAIGPLDGIQDAPAVASNGDNFLVVWHDRQDMVFPFYRTIQGARVTRAGIVLDQTPIPISMRENVQVTPSVASDGQNYFVAWNDDRNRQSTGFLDIYGARVTSGGVVLDPDGIPICTAPAEQYLPTVAAGSDGYLVAWLDHRNGRSGSFDLYGTRVSTSGEVRDTNGLALYFSNRNNSGVGFPALAGNGTGFLLVWSDESIYGTRVDNTGTVLDANPITVGQSPQREEVPAVASNGSEYLVVWHDSRGYRIFGARLSEEGEVFDPNGIIIGTQPTGGRPKVASDGTNFLVIWLNGALLGTRVSSAGTVLDPDPIFINRLVGNISSFDIASNGKSYLAVWGYSFVPNDDGVPASPFHIHAARLGSDGQLLDNAELELSTGENNQLLPAVASDGTDYLVVWEEGGIFGTRLDAAGLSIDKRPIAVCTAAGRKSDLAAASNGRDYLVVWTDERNFDTTGPDIYAAQVTHSGQVHDEAGTPITRALSAQSQPAVASNGKDYLVVWTDARNLITSGQDIFGARLNSKGLVADPEGFPINQNGFDQQLAAVAYGGNGSFLVVNQGFLDGSIRTVANLISGIPPTPHLHINRKSGGAVTLSWPAQEGETYLVQFKESVDCDWSNLGGSFTPKGPTATVEDETRDHVRFYRVIQIP